MIIATADRLKTIKEYYFSKKLEVIRHMQTRGLKVINLGIGNPDLSPSSDVIEDTTQALQKQESHGYATYRSSFELRRSISKWYQRTYGVRLDPECQILPLLGSKEGIFYVSLTFLNPGDRVLVPNPGYPAYSSAASLVGAQVHYYQLEERNSWYPDWEALEAMDLSGFKLMWVNYPHMPTGAKATDSVFSKLVEFGRKRRILICHDNPYSLMLNSESPKSILNSDPQLEVSLELNSMSKSFSMAGWRVGMLMTNEQVINSVLQVKSNVDSGMFLAIQAGAIAALRNSDNWHKERNRVYKQRRIVIYKIFDLLGFQYTQNQEGMFVWAKAPEHIPDVSQFLDVVLEKTLVFITPGIVFGTNGQRYARASLCAPIEVLHEAADKIQGALQSLFQSHYGEEQ